MCKMRISTCERMVFALCLMLSFAIRALAEPPNPRSIDVGPESSESIDRTAQSADGNSKLAPSLFDDLGSPYSSVLGGTAASGLDNADNPPVREKPAGG